MKLGLAHLMAIDLPPVALARMARANGFDEIGLRLAPAMPGGVAYPLPAGSTVAAEFRRVAEGEGVAVADVEFVALTPEVDVTLLLPLLAAGAGLGARSLTVSGDDPDPARLSTNFAMLCDLAQGYGLRVDLEFMVFRHVATLEQAVAMVRAAGRDNGSVLFDTLHFDRSCGDVAALGAVRPGMVRAIQLSDALAARPVGAEALIREARADRLAPGEGMLPLDAMLRAFPDATVSVEAPNDLRPLATRLQLAQDGARRVLKAAGWTKT